MSGSEEALRCLQEMEKLTDDTEIVFELDRLHAIGVGLRGQVGPRGTLESPAVALLETEELRPLRRLLKHPHAEVRCAAALAISEWGGDDDVPLLVDQLLSDDEPNETKLHHVVALRVLGGPKATEGLCQAASNSSEQEDIRRASVAALGVLASPAGYAKSGSQFRTATEGAAVEAARASLMRVAVDPVASSYLCLAAREIAEEI